MKKYILIALLVLPVFPVHSQINHCVFEQIAYDYLIDTIIPKEISYEAVKFFVYDGEIDTQYTSAYGNLCMTELSGEPLEIRCGDKIDTGKNPKVVKKVNFPVRLFVKKKHVRKLYIYPAVYDLDKRNILVAIHVSGEFTDDFYTLIIDNTTQKVIDYCNKRLET